MSSLHQILEQKSFDSLISFAEKFCKMYNNTFFKTAWKRHLDILLKNYQNPAVTELEGHVWQPALNRCCELVGDFHTLKVKLSIVHPVFKDCPENDIHRELTDFCKLVSDCTNHQSQFLGRSMSSAAEKIKQYFVILRHQEVASLFLQLKTTLRLNGDFKNIFEIARVV